MSTTRVPHERVEDTRKAKTNSRRRLLGTAAASALAFGALKLPKASPAAAQELSANTRKAYFFNRVINFQDQRPSIPYDASFVNVRGLRGTVEGIRIFLNGLTHTDLGDLDVMVRAPNGRFLMLLSDAGVGTQVTGLDLVFTDESTRAVPATGPIEPGTYGATNYDTTNDDEMPTPAQPPNITSVAQLTGLARQARGRWFLYTFDKKNGDGGSLRDWGIEFFTSNRAPRARRDTYTVEQGSKLRTSRRDGVLDNDVDRDGDRLSVVPFRENHRLGRLEMKQHGGFTFVAKRNRTGTARFRYEVSDGEAVDRGLLVIRVV